MSTATAHAAPDAEEQATPAGPPSHADPRPRRWTRDEYYKMAEAGILAPTERVELIDGEIIRHMSPIGPPHSTSVYKTAHVLDRAFGTSLYVDRERPIVISDGTEPQPDVWAAAGGVDSYANAHPRSSQVRLVVEVSDTTLNYDRRDKAALYASEGIPEYWIVNVPQRRLEVYRDPQPGVGYRTRIIRLEADTIAPLDAPESSINVASLLPLQATS